MSGASFRPYRAPRQHGASLVDPPLDECRQILDNAVQVAASWSLKLAGQSLQSVRARARKEVLQAAIEHTAAYRTVRSPEGSLLDSSPAEYRPLIFSGHQPELFHPGVWFKNFLLASVARQSQGLAINLLIDHDICLHPSIRVPTTGIDGQLTAVATPFDAAALAVPWEERGVLDESCFQSFAHRVEMTGGDWLDQPLVTRLWPFALESLARTGRVGLALAEARHRVEALVGLETLEVPYSKVSETVSFMTFVCEILQHLPRFASIYNDAVKEYRRAHRIRSRAHPVPDLGERNGWSEAPFWIYSEAAPYRKPLFVKRHGEQVELADLTGTVLRLNRSLDGLENGEALLQGLQRAGIKLRPRALMTTLYVRLVLSDLFIHGIGGGKYDQLTDLIFQRFFNIVPPPFCVVSGTVLLPDAPDQDAAAVRTRELQAKLRQIQYQPERFAEANLAAPRLVAEKRRLLNEQQVGGPKRQWHERVTRANNALSAALEPVRRRLADELLRSEQDLRRARLLNSREWSFCLFPLDYLRQSLETMLDAQAYS